MNTPPLDALTAPVQKLRFLDLELTLQPFRLSRNGRPLALQPQPLRLLAHLAERSGQIVGRDELREKFFGDRRFSDHEQGINFAIRKIRVALEDDHDQPRFIETIPRVGYRFLLPVTRVFEETPEPEPNPSVASASCAPEIDPPLVETVPEHARFEPEQARLEPSAEPEGVWVPGLAPIPGSIPGSIPASIPGKPASTPYGLIGLLILALALTTWVGAAWNDHAESSAVGKLAVLPFSAGTSGGDDSELAESISEELRQNLGQNCRHFAIVSAASSRVFADATLEATAAALQTQHLLSGTVFRTRGDLQIRLELFDSGRQENVWTSSSIVPWSALDTWFDATCHDLRRVASGDRGIDDPFAAKRAEQPNALTLPSEVQEDFLRARFLTSQPSPENLKQALAALESLSERFPRASILHEELGRTRLLLGGKKLSDFFGEVEAAADRALDLDPRSARGHLLRGQAALLRHLDFASAQEHLSQALEINPCDAEALKAFGLFLTAVGRVAEGTRYLNQAVELDPATAFCRSDLLLALYVAGETEAAVEQARAIRTIAPQNFNALSGLARIQINAGRSSAALEALNQLFVSHDLQSVPTLEKAISRRLEQIATRQREGYSLWTTAAVWQMLAGQREAARTALAAACEEPDWYTAVAAQFPEFAPFLGDPIFAAGGACHRLLTFPPATPLPPLCSIAS